MVSDVKSTDGVLLRVHESGTRGAPTVVCVHGYPDDHTVWDGVATELAARYHLVCYDVRGAGSRASLAAAGPTGSSSSPRTSPRWWRRSAPTVRCICWPTTGERSRPGMR